MAIDYSLVPTAVQVDLGAFDILYQQYHHAVYANILKIVGQPEAAEDLLQEVFMALWEHRHKLDSGKVAGWLFVTSFNKSLKHLKKKQKEQVLPFEQEGLYKEIPQEEALTEDLYSLQLAMVEEAVNQLPERKKEVFRLCRYEGKSYDEVAALLGISVNSVRDYLKQSTRFIKDYIAMNQSEVAISSAVMLVLYFG